MSIDDIEPDPKGAGELGDSDSEDEALKRSGPQTTSTKRRAQNALFSSWVVQKAESVSKEKIKEAIKSADDETLSITNLLAKQESKQIITDPREYQLELFEKAKHENIIAVLDTGSGKTLIAVLLLKHIIDQELEDRAAGKPRRISFFLASRLFLRGCKANGPPRSTIPP